MKVYNRISSNKPPRAILLTIVVLFMTLSGEVKSNVSTMGGLSLCEVYFYPLDLSALEYDLGETNSEISEYKQNYSQDFNLFVRQLSSNQLFHSPVYKLVLYKVINFYNAFNLSFYKMLQHPQYVYFGLNPLPIEKLGEKIVEQLNRLQTLISQEPDKAKMVIESYLNSKKLLSEDLSLSLEPRYHELYWFDPYWNEEPYYVIRRITRSSPAQFPNIHFEDEEVALFSQSLRSFQSFKHPMISRFFSIEAIQQQEAYNTFISQIKDYSFITNPLIHGFVPAIMKAKPFDPRYGESGYRVVDSDVRYLVEQPNGSMKRVYGTGLVFQFREGTDLLKAEEIMFPKFNGFVHPMLGDSDPDNLKLEMWNINTVLQSFQIGLSSNEYSTLLELADELLEIIDRFDRNLLTKTTYKKELAKIIDRIIDHGLLIRSQLTVISKLLEQHGLPAENQYSIFTEELDRIKNCLESNNIEDCPEILMERYRVHREKEVIDGEIYIRESLVDNLQAERVNILIDDIFAHRELSERYRLHIHRENNKLRILFDILESSLGAISKAINDLHENPDSSPQIAGSLANTLKEKSREINELN